MSLFSHLYPEGFDDSVEGIDYTINKHGLRVSTEYFLAKRGYCCSNGCKNCPYTPRAIKGNTKLRSGIAEKYKL
ncbi:MAG: DUF5522 domain-containing protein [Mangrovibacterium sp.]